ncbi:gamma-glutamyl hydrolase-like isoform X1 [Schistocerca cancellata]|uniref:gamma-glutamyl hydrolase-like isoform X1 n=1 Tax=Schistocerca cancellata TaxID=274614 RepID=UPI002118BC44|nr:gamma-glutamyl hydrolase-like isoform X1 [Schistocerca cancellata]
MHIAVCLLLLFTVVKGIPLRRNDRPIIGILSQELSPTVSGIFGNHSSYIAASYVKYVEGAGGRVVPIWVNQTESYYREVISRINGLLFPGGASYFTNTDGYAAAGEILYNLTVGLNENGDYFPLWSTCLGFELMLYLAAGQREHRCSCSANDVALPLEFTHDFNESSLFGAAPENVITALGSQNITANYHNFCVTQKNLTEFGLSGQWHVLSVNHDINGVEFISSIQSRLYPFYGVIFHPEKNAYEWKSNKNIPHSSDAVVAMQYFANFFVNEARKNFHSFPSVESEESALIYKYTPTYTGDHLIYEQCYFFDY